MAKPFNELKILLFVVNLSKPNKLVNGFAVAAESHASTPLPTFVSTNLVEPQRAKDRHWHYTNTLAVSKKPKQPENYYEPYTYRNQYK